MRFLFHTRRHIIYGGSAFKFLFICLFLAVLSLCCALGLSLVVVGGLLIVVASLVEHGLWSGGVQYFLQTGPGVVAHGLSCPVADRFLTIGPPGKSSLFKCLRNALTVFASSCTS